MTYIFTILSADLIIVALNFLADGVYTAGAFFTLLLYNSLGVAAVIAIDGIFALIARRMMPPKWFAPEAKLFFVGKKEQNLYRKSGINKWKKHVPELGCFTGFHKNEMKDRSSSEYAGRFLVESNYGVLGHVFGAIFGFLIMLLPFLRPLAMGLPIAVVNFVLSMLPTMILRFNTPPLRNIYRRNLEREKRIENKEKTAQSV